MVDAAGWSSLAAVGVVASAGANGTALLSTAGALQAVGSLERTRSASQLLGLTESLMDSLAQSTPPGGRRWAAAAAVARLDGGCASGACRRLLGSSRYYRLAMRKMLLTRLSGTSSWAMHRLTAVSFARSTQKLVSVPSELDASSMAVSLALFARSVRAMDASGLRAGAISQLPSFSYMLLEASRLQLDGAAIDAVAAALAEILAPSLGVYASTMLPGEAPLNSSFQAVEVSASRLALSAGPAADRLTFAPRVWVNVSGLEEPLTGSASAAVLRMTFPASQLLWCVCPTLPRPVFVSRTALACVSQPALVCVPHQLLCHGVSPDLPGCISFSG